MTGRFAIDLLRRVATVALLLAVASCAGGGRKSLEYDSRNARGVFAKAYESVYDKYLESVEGDTFAFKGIAGLAKLDDSFSARRAGPLVHVAIADTDIGAFKAPARDDLDGWARLTTQAIDQARLVSPALAQATSEDLYAAVLNGALEPLDRHSRYAGLRSARDSRALREGFGGIGIRLDFESGAPTVGAILPDTPAEKAGLKPGDILLEVDGGTLAGLDRNAVVWKLRGDVGSEMTLRVRRAGLAQSLLITLRRARIVPETVYVTRLGALAQITLSSFNQRTARNLNRVLDTLARDRDAPVRGIILDLRGNPGGLLDQAVAVADSFLGRGRIVSTRGRHPDSYQVFNATGRDLVSRLPLVVLINGRSASAAEIVAAALQDHGRAVVVGSNSYGKGSVQNITRLPNDGELILTWARFHAPSGYALENLGVLPNFCTNPAQGSPAASLDRQATDSTILLAAWRGHLGYDAETFKPMRRRCPGTAERPQNDIEVARRVLADRPLYARALAASAPSVARSPDQGARLRVQGQ